MSTKSTLQHFKGKWKFDGETPYGFDEVDLRISEEKVIYILKKNGIEVKTKDIPNKNDSTDDDRLMFFEGSSPVFFVSAVNETSMICGEVAGEAGRTKLWEV